MPAKIASPAYDTHAFDAFMNKMSLKERAKIEKHLDACDASPLREHGMLWRRVAAVLGQFAPLAVQSVGSNAWKFMVPDGKYRKQVFAIEDRSDSRLVIYMPDVLERAIAAGVITPTDQPGEYAVAGSHTPLAVDSLDTDDASAAAHYKHMLGWNRRALRVSLSTATAEGPLPAAAMAMAALAAEEWAAADSDAQ